MAPDLSVILPTRDRPAKLERCLRALSRQTLDARRCEILVGIDGADEPSATLAERVLQEARLAGRVVRCERLGVGGVKNELLKAATGRFLVSINDDVYAEPGFLEAHLTAQEQVPARPFVGTAGPTGGPGMGEALRLAGTDDAPAHTGAPVRGAMILGDSPWIVPAHDTLFDRLVRETSMVFFYDRMPGSSAAHTGGADDGPEARIIEPIKDWGFRHAWNLNLSMPTDAVRAAGGFARFPCAYGFEDLELAWRLRRRFAMPVLFRPEAVALHDHRYTPDDYLLREMRLGYAAAGFAAQAPACARETFGRDVLDPKSAEYFRAYAEHERGHALRVAESFRALAHFPSHFGTMLPGAAASPLERTIVRALYEHHLPLKRWAWRIGFLASQAGAPMDSLRLDEALADHGAMTRHGHLSRVSA